LVLLSQQALTDNKQTFNAIAAFTNTTRVIDCTHVLTKSPPQNEEAFVNRKGVHTINVQALCYAKMCPLDIAAKWPVEDTTHSSGILAAYVSCLTVATYKADGYLVCGFEV